jgi:hypothetical protein
MGLYRTPEMVLVQHPEVGALAFLPDPVFAKKRLRQILQEGLQELMRRYQESSHTLLL